MAYTVRELSSRTFSDFEKIAAKQGGCWCMYYQRAKPVRLKSSDPKRKMIEWKKINRKDKKLLVEKGQSHAILVYDNDTPVGWCQYGAKRSFPGLTRGEAIGKWDLPLRMRNYGG